MIQDESYYKSVSFMSKEFDCESIKRNFWPMKFTNFVSLLLEEDFLEEDLNYQKIIEIYNSITFNEEYKSNIKQVSLHIFIFT